MEGVHFGAGPWFAVRSSDDPIPTPFGTVWWSDGTHDGQATLTMQTTLLPAAEES